MAIGNIAKQFAQQALADQVAPQPSTPAQLDSVGAIMLGQIQAMQKACKVDEELVILFQSGAGDSPGAGDYRAVVDGDGTGRGG